MSRSLCHLFVPRPASVFLQVNGLMPGIGGATCPGQRGLWTALMLSLAWDAPPFWNWVPRLFCLNWEQSWKRQRKEPGCIVCRRNRPPTGRGCWKRWEVCIRVVEISIGGDFMKISPVGSFRSLLTRSNANATGFLRPGQGLYRQGCRLITLILY